MFVQKLIIGVMAFTVMQSESVNAGFTDVAAGKCLGYLRKAQGVLPAARAAELKRLRANPYGAASRKPRELTEAMPEEMRRFPVNGKYHTELDSMSPEAQLKLNAVKNNLNADKRSTLKIVRVLAGRHGGAQFELKRKSWFGSWQEDAIEGGAHLQGDVRWVIEILGSYTASFFGFELKDLNDPSVVLVPDADELNGAISQFNSAMPPGSDTRIAVQFYSERVLPFTPEKYLRRFAMDLKLPLGASGPFFSNSLAYSVVGAILMSPRVLRQAELQAQAAIELADYLRANRLHYRVTHDTAEAFIEQMFADLKNEIQHGIEDVTLSVKKILEIPPVRLRASIDIEGLLLRRFASSGVSALRYLSVVKAKRFSRDLRNDRSNNLAEQDKLLMMAIDDFALDKQKTDAEYSAKVLPEVWNMNTSLPTYVSNLENMQDIIAKIAKLGQLVRTQ